MGSSGAVDCHGKSERSTSWSAEGPSALVAVVVNLRGQRTGGDGTADPAPAAASISRVVSSWLNRVMSRVLQPVSPRSSAIRPSARPTSIRNRRVGPGVGPRSTSQTRRPSCVCQSVAARASAGSPVTTPCGWRTRWAAPSSASGQNRTHVAACVPISSAGAVALTTHSGGLGAASATSPGRRRGRVRTADQHEEAHRGGRQQESHGTEAHEFHAK